MFKALVGLWKREGTGRMLLRFSKCIENLVIFRFIRFFILDMDTNSKGTRGHTFKLVKTQCTRDITKYVFKQCH